VGHKDHHKDGSYISQAKKAYQAGINAFSDRFICLPVGPYDDDSIKPLILQVNYPEGGEKSETPV
jgi:hypothetical protein